MLLPRKKTGSNGRRVKVVTNCFALTNFPSVPTIFHYDFALSREGKNEEDFQPPPALSERIFRLFDEQYSKSLGNVNPVFDGKKNVYTAFRLPFDNQATYVIQPPGDRTSFLVKLKLVNQINLGELAKFIEGQAEATANCQAAIQALDILLRYKPSLTNPVIGRSFFTRHDSRPIAGMLCIYSSCST
jgi:eukaryotic translation initiation factor 2C